MSLDLKISQLDEDFAPALTDFVAVVVGANTRKIQLGNLGVSGSQSPWLTDIDADDNSLDMGTGIISFKNTTQSISGTNSIDLELDVPASGQIDMNLNSISEFTFHSTGLLINDNPIKEVGYIETNTVNPGQTGFMRLANDLELTDSIVWRNDANTSDIRLFVDGADKLRVNAGIRGTWYEAGGIVPSGSATATLRMGFDKEIAWRNQNDNTDYHIDISSNTGTRLRYGPQGNPANIITNTSSDNIGGNVLTNKAFGDNVGFNDNNLLEVGEIQFSLATQNITSDAGGIIFNIPTGDIYEWKVNGNVEMRLDVTQPSPVLDLALTNGVNPLHINFENGGGIRWLGDGSRAITNSTGNGTQFRVDVGDQFTWHIDPNGMQEMRLNVSLLAIDNKYFELKSIAEPAVTGADTTGRVFMDSGNSNHLSIRRNGATVDLEGTIAQTPWVADVDAADFNLTNLGYLESGTTNPAQSEFLRLAKTDRISWRNNANSADIDLFLATSDTLEFNGGMKVNFIQNGGVLPGVGFVRLDKFLEIAWRNFANDGDNLLGTNNSGDNLRWNGVDIPTISSTNTLTNKQFGSEVDMNGNNINFDFNAQITWNDSSSDRILVTSSGMNFDISGATDDISFAIDSESSLRIFKDRVDVNGHNINNIQNLEHDLSTSGVDIDFDEDELQEISIAANTVFTGANYTIGRAKTLKIITDATLRTLTFPAGWIFVGAKPADQAASKTGILTLQSFTAAEAGVVCAYAVEA